MTNEGFGDLDPEASHRMSKALAGLDNMSDSQTATSGFLQPDRRDGSVYRCPPSLLLALKTALVTGRPLLLQGRPGSGKSSIAAYVARNLGWRYYEFVVDARTEPNDLLWRFDLVRRLADAQVMERGGSLNDHDYVEPGPLWWMLDQAGARFRGSAEAPARFAIDPNAKDNEGRAIDGCVLLIDEIDKAEPDVPGGLLVPLGSFRFTVQETGAVVDAGSSASSRLVIITTNEDQELPSPFVRRCVVHRLEPPSQEDLLQIANSHLRTEGVDPETISAEDRQLLDRLAANVAYMAEEAQDDGGYDHYPSIAEFLDAVRALRQLSSLDQADRDFIERLLLRKRDGADR